MNAPATGAARTRFALVAGEASGDQLGAGLVEALQRRYPDAEFAGIGGDAMRAAGVDTWFDAGELAVMGLAEVVRELPRLLRLRSALRRRVLAWRPDAFIGIDAPDFNLGVERWLKRRGVATVHYVSPSVWAWRESRAAGIGASADRVLCLFPMEPAIYARHGVDARFVGHPLADGIALEPDRGAAREALGIPFHAPLLAVLPGSRLGEIRRMLPVFLEAAVLVSREMPELALVIPAANAACRAAIEQALRQGPASRAVVLDGHAQRAMIAADVVLLASGTAALEAMLCKRPMVVGHRIAPATHRIVRGLGMLKSAHVSLPNVLAGEALVPELLQDDCTADALAAEVLRWFREPEAVAALRPRFRALHEQLRRDASEAAADAIVEVVDRR
jgi:lipid-A-disaccharide synthase